MRVPTMLSLVVLALAPSWGQASTIFSYQGDFTQDDDMAISTFSLSAQAGIHSYTLSYAGSSAAPGGTAGTMFTYSVAGGGTPNNGFSTGTALRCQR
jgi:hypothetical protein